MAGVSELEKNFLAIQEQVEYILFEKNQMESAIANLQKESTYWRKKYIETSTDRDKLFLALNESAHRRVVENLHLNDLLKSELEIGSRIGN